MKQAVHLENNTNVNSKSWKNTPVWISNFCSSTAWPNQLDLLTRWYVAQLQVIEYNKLVHQNSAKNNNPNYHNKKSPIKLSATVTNGFALLLCFLGQQKWSLNPLQSTIHNKTQKLKQGKCWTEKLK